MSLTAPQLVQRLPPSWWGLFGAMRADHRHGDAVEVWYQSEAKSGYGGLPDWDELLASLLDEEPVCEGSSLCFKPKFVQLPCDIQCQFLKFVSKHCEEVPLCALSEFVYTVQSCDANPESWPGILLKTLCTYIKISNKSYVGYETLRDADTPYPFTSGNAGAVTSLCDKVRQSSRQCSTWKRMHLTESPTLRKNIEMEVRPKTSSDWCPASDPPPSPGDVATPEVDDVPTKHSEDIITILSDNEEEMEVLESKEEDTNVDILFTEAEMKESCVEEETVDPILLGKGEKLRESWQSGLDTSEIDLFLTASPHQINAVARVVGWSSLSDGEVLAACHSLSTLSSVLSDATSVQFMSSMVLPKVVGLQQSASRQLLGVISLAAEHFPRGLIDGVFKTCLEQGIGSAQTDVFCKAIKTALSDSSKVQMLRRLMECTRNLDDNIICLFQTLLDTKVAMADDTLTELVNTLHSNASRMEKNLKYGKLLLAVINKHGPQITNYQCLICEFEVCKRSLCERHPTTSHSGFGFRCSGCKVTFSRIDMKHGTCPRGLMALVKRENMKFGDEENKEYDQFQKNRHVDVGVVRRPPTSEAERTEVVAEKYERPAARQVLKEVENMTAPTSKTKLTKKRKAAEAVEDLDSSR